MAIDWTIAAISHGATGKVEYRVENDGLVRWRGIVTFTDSYGYIYFPAAAIPLDTVIPFIIDSEPLVGRYIFCPLDAPPPYFFFNYGMTVPIGGQMDISFVYYGTPPPEPDHTLENVQAGLTAALHTIAGLRVYGFPSDRIEPPAAILSLPETPYDVTLGGRSDEWTFPLWILVAKASDKASYAELTQYLEAQGSKSIRAVLETDRTLSGACDTIAVVNASPQIVAVAGTEFLAIKFTLEVYT